jgi:enoyl-CoA hydratase
MGVVVERDGTALVVTLNRPQTRNALDASIAAGLQRALSDFSDDDSLLVCVVTGAGGCFSSGLDLKELSEDGIDTSLALKRLMRMGSPKPMIAAVEGYALAGGFELALTCDLIVASREARFGLPEVRRMLVANSGGLLRLPARIGHQAAAEIALTGEPMGAERLYDLGLVNRLVEEGEALAAARALAAQIAEGGSIAAIAATKEILSLASAADHWTRQDRVADQFFESGDARAAAKDFLDERRSRAAR